MSGITKAKDEKTMQYYFLNSTTYIESIGLWDWS